MFVDLIEDHEKKFERLNGPMETAQAQGSGGPDVETSQVQDDWVLQGEYLVRRHFVPRTTLFSPWEWKQNQIAINAKYHEPMVPCDGDNDDERLKASPIAQLEVSRKTRPNNKILEEYWDTWCR